MTYRGQILKSLQFRVLFPFTIQVLKLIGPYEPGTWRYQIHVDRDFVGQTTMIVAHLNVKNEVVVQGFLDSQASMGSVNGSSIQAVKAFAYVENQLENTFEVSCKALMHQDDDNQEISDVHLKDNGLTSKRITVKPRFFMVFEFSRQK